MRLWHATLTLIVCLGSGCTAIPEGGDPGAAVELRRLAARDAECLGSAAVALPRIALAPEEESKGWDLRGAGELNPELLCAELVAGLRASGSFRAVQPVGEDAWREAWEARDDLLVEVELLELRARFLGHNGWWIPNLIVWSWLVFPAWWIPTEDYRLEGSGRLVLRDVASGVELAAEELPLAVEGSFDEFDRGWHLIGPLLTPLDPERWQRIVERLFPALRTRLAVEAALRSDALLRRARARPDYAARVRQTLVLAVGVGEYADAQRFPPLPAAARDAGALGELLEQPEGAAAQVTLLRDGEATAARVGTALGELGSRLRDSDLLLVYLAGYGTRGRAGEAQVLLHNADGAGEGRLSLPALAARLGSFPGVKLLVVDAGFDAGPRWRAGAPGDVEDVPDVDDLAPFAARAGLGVLLAASPGQPALAPGHLNHGLFSDHLLRGLAGAADRNSDGRVSEAELLAQLREAVLADAALLGIEQSPRGSEAGLGQLRVPPGALGSQ